ncbi:hypothetical protein [Secundilactobacillus silagei]|uniref:hypothetical protein n=1 Tax=Secundilactobacillus silagei TaxID=1293415 RepID=UPI000AEB9A55|nr:hypothetical protein [Secundilactobacillus silagei]
MALTAGLVLGGLGVTPALPAAGKTTTSWKVVKTKKYSDVACYPKKSGNAYMWNLTHTKKNSQPEELPTNHVVHL